MLTLAQSAMNILDSNEMSANCIKQTVDAIFSKIQTLLPSVDFCTTDPLLLTQTSQQLLTIYSENSDTNELMSQISKSTVLKLVKQLLFRQCLVTTTTTTTTNTPNATDTTTTTTVVTTTTLLPSQPLFKPQTDLTPQYVKLYFIILYISVCLCVVCGV